MAPASTLPPVDRAPGVPRTATTQNTEMGPGEATLAGTVTGPEGPVTGATVRIERFIGDQDRHPDGADGRRSVVAAVDPGRLLPGRGLPPAGPGPARARRVLPRRHREQAAHRPSLVRYGSTGVTATIDPNPPLVGLPATLTVHYGGGAVDPATGDVVTSGTGRACGCRSSTGPGFAVESAPVAVTDGSGAVSWVVRCLQPGPVPVNLRHGRPRRQHRLASRPARSPPRRALAAPPPTPTGSP